MDNKQLTNSKFGKWGWSMIIYTMLLYYFWAGMSVDGLNVYTNAFGGTYGMDPNVLLGFATPAGIIGIVGGILFGRLVIKTGVRKLCSWALIGVGVLFALFGFAKTPVLYLIALSAITFVAQAFGLIATATLMGNWFPNKKGIALGWATMGAPLCTATFVAILSGLYGKFGVGIGHTIIGVVVVILGVISFWWIKDYPEEVGAYPDNIPTDPEVLKAQLGEVKSYKSPFTVKTLLKDKDMWLIALGFGMLWMVTVGIVSQFVPRMMSVGYDNATALMMLTIAAVVGLVGSYFWGWLDQKVGTKPASVVYGISYVLALIMLIFAKVEILTYIAIALVGFGVGGLLNLMASMVIAVYGRWDFMAANSLISPIASLVQKAAFVIMAIALAASGGDYTIPYLIFVVIDIIGIVLLLCVTNKCKGKQV